MASDAVVLYVSGRVQQWQLGSCGSGHLAPDNSSVHRRPPAASGRSSEALVKGYAHLLPDLRFEAVTYQGSLRNLQELQDGTADMGLAQAGLAHMAYNGRLSESAAFKNIRGIAVLNSSPVHLLWGPIDRSVGRRPEGTPCQHRPRGRRGHLTIRPARLFPGEPDTHQLEVPRGTTAMLVDNSLDAAFAVSSVPSEEVWRHTTAGARLLELRGPAVD